MRKGPCRGPSCAAGQEGAGKAPAAAAQRQHQYWGSENPNSPQLGARRPQGSCSQCFA